MPCKPLIQRMKFIPDFGDSRRSSARWQAPASIHDYAARTKVKPWIPAFAGMTKWASFESRRPARLVL